MSAKDSKDCPDCAESVLVAARVCRFCGFRFGGAADKGSAETAPPDPPGDAASDANLRRAYRDLLGNDYGVHFNDHITISALASVYAQDLETAWKWQLESVGIALPQLPPHSYQPTMITDVGSALFGFDSWHRQSPAVGLRIAAFVRALNAKLLVLSYATTSGRNHESLALLATDGFVAREAHWSIEHKRGGRREITPMRRGDGARQNSRYGLAAGADPTIERPPREDWFLGQAVFEIRENQ